MSGETAIHQHHYRQFDTALGVCGIAWSNAGLTRVLLPDVETAKLEKRLRTLAVVWEGPLPDHVARWLELLVRYADGEAVDFSDIALDERCTNAFSMQLYRALQQVRWGHTTTYGDLAKAVEAPGAARAVGMAMGRNPWPVVVPCHRVLASGQKMGGFSAPGGTLTKERLLALEGVFVGDGTPLLPGLFSR
jgi:methylated-DNA-[protein]-cysteine S-methyltransferase